MSIENFAKRMIQNYWVTKGRNRDYLMEYPNFQNSASNQTISP